MAKDASHPADDAAVARATETLYAGPLEAFVAERKRLAGELRAAGDRAAAAAVAEAQKPTLSAWVVNQLARREREGMRRLVEASAALRETQMGLPSGGAGREAFGEAMASQRRELGALREAAERILVEGGHPATPSVLERVARNLRALVAGGEPAELVATGRLVRDLPPEGLADFATLAATLPAAPPRRAPPPAAHQPQAKAEARRTAAAEAERAKEIAGLRKAVHAAEKRALETAEDAERARRAADHAEAAAGRAKADVAEARRRLVEAESRS